jgi:hypothetical protein
MVAFAQRARRTPLGVVWCRRRPAWRRCVLASWHAAPIAGTDRAELG